MPTGRHKSKTLRRVFVKTPGGRTALHYRKRKPKNARCASCSTVLKGTLRERPYKMMRLAKTKKRPTRPYGGNLCSKCTRIKIIKKIRAGKK